MKDYYGITFNNPFGWDDSPTYYCAEMLLNALSSYITTYRPKEEHTSESIYKILVANSEQGYIRCPNATNVGSLLDAIFEELRLKVPCCIELEYYEIFKAFPLKQRLSVIATLMAYNFSLRGKAIENSLEQSKDRFVTYGKYGTYENFYRQPKDLFVTNKE